MYCVFRGKINFYIVYSQIKNKKNKENGSIILQMTQIWGLFHYYDVYTLIIMTISASSLNGRRHMAKVGINREIGHLTEIADCRETCSLYQYKRIQEIIHIIYYIM